MKTSWRSLCSVVQSFVSTRDRRRRLKPHFGIEAFEARLLLAAVSDRGEQSEQLHIELAVNELLTVQALQGQYQFTVNTLFVDGGLQSPDAFFGLSSGQLNLHDLSAYSSIKIQSAAGSTSVHFLNSGDASYVHPVEVESVHGSAISFSGASRFGNDGLSVTTDGLIEVQSGSFLSVRDGDLLLSSNQSDSASNLAGVLIDTAELESRGQGSISIDGRVSNVGAAGEISAAVSIVDSVISSKLNDASSGSLTITGHVSGSEVEVSGLSIDGSRIESVGGQIQLSGRSDDGAASPNGVLISGQSKIQIASLVANPGQIIIQGDVRNSEHRSVGVQLNYGVTVEANYGDVAILGSSQNAQAGLVHGVSIDGASVRTRNEGSVRIQGTAGPNLNANGVRIGRSGQIATESGELLISATINQAAEVITRNSTAVEISNNASIMSNDGQIQIEAHQDRVANGIGLHVRGGQILANGSASIDIAVDGVSDEAALKLDAESVIGGSSATGLIDLQAGSFLLDPLAVVQTTSSVRIGSTAFWNRLIVGRGTDEYRAFAGAEISQQDLQIFHPEIRRLHFGGISDDGYDRTQIGDVKFAHEVWLFGGFEAILTGDVDVSQHGLEINGNLSLSERSAIITGNVTISSYSSLRMRAGGFSDQLIVDGQFDIEPHVMLDVAWGLEDLYSTTLIDRSAGNGTFENIPDFYPVPNVPGGTLRYESGNTPSIRLEISASAIQTEVVRTSDLDSGYTRIQGPVRNQFPGLRAEAVGDVNGDGFDDFLVINPSPATGSSDGDGPSEMYLVYGHSDFEADLSNPELIDTSVRLTSTLPHHKFGYLIRHADLNRDGFSDIVVANSPENQSFLSPSVHIVWGRAEYSNELAVTHTTDGVTAIRGLNERNRLTDIMVIEDLNGDGWPEFAMADANFSDDENRGHGRTVVLAGMSQWPDIIDVRSEEFETVTIFGTSDSMAFGRAVASIADINNDSVSDFVVAADSRPNAEDRNEGAFYVFASDPQFFDERQKSINNAQQVLYGGGVARSIQSWAMGDLNGDGVSDLVVGHEFFLLGEMPQHGGANIYWGPFSGDEIDLTASTTPQTQVLGPEEFSSAGHHVELIPDISGDGLSELLIGAPGEHFSFSPRDSASDVWLLRGREAWPDEVNFGHSGDADFRIVGPRQLYNGKIDALDLFGSFISSGDFDGNGQHDLLISAPAESPGYNWDNGGVVHVLSGNSFFDITPPTLQLGTPLSDPTNAKTLIFDAAISEPFEGLSASDFEIVTSEGVVNASLVDIDVARTEGGARFFLRRFNTSDFYTLRVASNATITDEGGLALDPATVQPVTVNLGKVGPEIIRPDSTAQDSVPALEWRRTHNTAAYDVWIQPIDSNADPIIERGFGGGQGGLTATWYPPEALAPGRYRFWVRSHYDDETYSPWTSEPFVVNPLLTVRQSNFADAFRPKIEWDAILGVSDYRVFVTDVSRQTGGFIDETVSGTSFAPVNDWTSGRYRFWVAAVSESGFQGDWSGSVTIDITPTLLAMDTTQLPRPTLLFSSVPSTDEYEIYVSGAGIVYRQSTSSGSSLTLDQDLSEGHYRAWIRGIADNVAGPWSHLSEFSVGAVTKVPTTSIDIIDPVVQLSWPAVPSAETYDLLIRDNESMEVIYRSFRQSGNSSSEIPLPDGTYNVWVKTNRSQGSAWGGVTEIIVRAQTQPRPWIQYDGPVAISMNQTPRFVLGSNSFNRADKFEIFLQSDGILIRETIVGSSAEWSPSTPLPRGEWTWWVRGLTREGGDTGILYGGNFNTSGQTSLQVAERSATPTQPLFLWEPVEEAVEYDLRIDWLSLDAERYVSETIRDRTHFEVRTELPSGNYRAWIRPRNLNGLYGSWSRLIDFEI